MTAEVNNDQNMDLNKTKAMFNMKSMRILLMTITSILIILALTMVVSGNITYWYYHSFEFFFKNASMRRFVTPSALCIFIGSGLLAVSLFGFYGAYKKSTCMVNSYAAILFVFLILKLVAICLTYTFDKGAAWHRFDIPIWNMHDPEIQAEVDYLQSSLGCCGNSYYTDYMDIELPSNMSTVAVSIQDSQSIFELPASCCRNEGSFCYNIWPNGCKIVLFNTLDHNAISMGILAVSNMIVNLLGIIFALLLAHSIRRMKSEKALVSWKLKEQIIFARQLEEANGNEQSNYVNNIQQANMV